MYLHYVTAVWSLLMSPRILAVQSDKVYWEKETRVILGKDAKLFCNASTMPECCNVRTRRWVYGPSDDILLSNGVSTNLAKYTEILKNGGFTLLIKNVTENDVNITYTCSYGFEQYTSILFLDKITQDEKEEDPDSEETSDSILVPVIISVVVFVTIVLVIVLICFILKKRQKEKYDTTEAMTFHSSDNKNIADIYHDKQNDHLIEMKNSEDTEHQSSSVQT